MRIRRPIMFTDDGQDLELKNINNCSSDTVRAQVCIQDVVWMITEDVTIAKSQCCCKRRVVVNCNKCWAGISAGYTALRTDKQTKKSSDVTTKSSRR